MISSVQKILRDERKVLVSSTQHLQQTSFRMLIRSHMDAQQSCQDCCFHGKTPIRGYKLFPWPDHIVTVLETYPSNFAGVEILHVASHCQSGDGYPSWSKFCLVSPFRLQIPPFQIATRILPMVIPKQQHVEAKFELASAGG